MPRCRPSGATTAERCFSSASGRASLRPDGARAHRAMELGALSYGKGTIEDYLGVRGLQKLGKKKWRKTVERLVARFTSALLLDDCVIGEETPKS